MSVKRLLGRSFTDPAVRVLDYGVGFRIKAGPQGMALLQVNDQEIAPAQVASMILTRVRKAAERRFGGELHKAVLSVPAEASWEYIAALKRAAALAEIEIVQFIVEPVAGALAFGLHKQVGTRRLAVCDFGGGTYDLALIVQDGLEFHTVAYGGDPMLGGNDFDVALAEAVAATVVREGKPDPRRDVARWTEYLVRCESVKRQLSSQPDARLFLKDPFNTSGLHDINIIVDRAWMEPRWEPLVLRALELTRKLLSDTGWLSEPLDDVVLIGGTTLMPCVKNAFSAFFYQPVRTSERADLAVAVGAALRAAAYTSAGADGKLPIMAP